MTGVEIPGRFHQSEHNLKRGAPPEPLIYFGHNNDFLAKVVADDSTFNGLAVDTLAELEAALAAVPCIGLVARSLEDVPGSAGQAIMLFRRFHRSDEMAIYLPWALDVQRAAERAVEYGADGILMSGMLTGEMLATLMDALRRVKTNVPKPGTAEEYVRILRQVAPDSPFWEMQGVPPERFKPGRYRDPDRYY